MKSKPKEPIHHSFHTLKWHHGYATFHFMKHINQYHAADITSDQKSASAAQSSPRSKNNGIWDVAIESYRKLPVLLQGADPLGFWRDNSLHRLLLPLAASVSAVPATEATCERLFKAGGQESTSARLRLLGSKC
jgi:hypothetical protein